MISLSRHGILALGTFAARLHGSIRGRVSGSDRNTGAGRPGLADCGRGQRSRRAAPRAHLDLRSFRDVGGRHAHVLPGAPDGLVAARHAVPRSLNPESCILRSADSFHKRGRVLLLFAKFVPGINTMSPPLAGSMNMRFGQFLGLDAAGASLYIGAAPSAGFLFSGALDAVINGYHAAGRVLGWAIAAAVVTYLGIQVWTWRKAGSLRSVPFVSAARLSARCLRIPP